MARILYYTARFACLSVGLYSVVSDTTCPIDVKSLDHEICCTYCSIVQNDLSA